MRKLFFFFLLFLAATIESTGQAQEAVDIRFAGFPVHMPKPLPSLKATMEAYGNADQMNKALKSTEREIDGNLRLIYAPLLSRFKKRLAHRKDLQPNTIGKDEQLLLKAFQTGSKGVSENGLMDIFFHVMEYGRPLTSLGKLSWTKLHPAASKPFQALFQQIKEIEAQFDWTGFAEQAKAYRPTFGESEDEKSRSLYVRFDEAFKKLPKIKVQENGISLDMEEPDSAIALLEQYRRDAEQAVEQYHQPRYQWWTSQHHILVVMCQKLDTIASQANDKAVTDADRSIQGAIADLQARIWGA